MNAIDQMRLFLEPRSVALIGVTRRTGRGSFNILENLLNLSFPGKIYPVNPNTSDILGLKTYPNVEALPEGIDLSVIMVPRHTVPRIVGECAEKGIKALIVITEGFAEADEDGRALQAEMLGIARSKGARIIGPNSLGVVNNFHNFTSTFLPTPRERIPVALVSQSGGFFEGFSDFSAGKCVDLGNTSDIGFADVLEYLEDDHETKLIALHMEGVGDGRRFFDVARRVSRRKPILVLKTGWSEQAKRAAASHSGSLTGAGEVYGAVFKQAGLIRIDSVDELGDITRAFLNLPPMKGNQIAIITPTGAGAIMVLDAMGQYGLERAKLSEATVDRIKGLFPSWSPPINPIDMMSAGIAHGYKNVYQKSLEALIEDENVDAILCIAGSPTVKTIAKVAGGQHKPVITWVIGKWGESLSSRIEETGYKAVYSTPERALRALSTLREYSVREEALG